MMESDFKCTKAIFIPTRVHPTRVHQRELDMYDAFFNYYGYDIYTRKNPLLIDIYEYVKKKSSIKNLSFCSKGSKLGINTAYLSNHILKIINGKDVTTTIMCCYNKDNNQPYSILLYNYDEEKNSIYIESVCADQTTGKESNGSGGLLIKSLVDAVSDTGKIEHIYLHAIESAIPTYLRNGFKLTGNTHKDDDLMFEMKITFQTLDVDEPSSEPLGNVSPEYNPHSPEYNPHSPEYNPHSPKPWSNFSPVYKPNSPVYNPGSPEYNPHSPEYNPHFSVDDTENYVISGPNSESNEVVPYGGRRSCNKTKKRTCKTKKRNCKTKKTKKRTCKTKKRNCKKNNSLYKKIKI